MYAGSAFRVVPDTTPPPATSRSFHCHNYHVRILCRGPRCIYFLRTHGVRRETMISSLVVRKIDIQSIVLPWVRIVSRSNAQGFGCAAERGSNALERETDHVSTRNIRYEVRHRTSHAVAFFRNVSRSAPDGIRGWLGSVSLS